MPNTIRTRSGRVLELPPPEEDKAINRGIAADPDTYEVSDEQFKKMKRRGERGRPRLESPKLLLSVRYDADIVEAFKASGDGWQTRINDTLREWLKTHRPA
ncbi:BrnA antitoxin family protein [Caballeronia sp. ATUFL_F1_KS4A]|uniref:BrnA antitoxin family protein n=1 Tax=Caballeronia sp. ATUFL_F1_KS4A TaxID=2921768 RepID=UPI0020289E1C|nr:BrnA antitoxin family protein [Caballeronia sp. ATUFL_F1_KS4A]